MKILHRFTKEVMFESDTLSLQDLVTTSKAGLSNAYLSNAYLSNADLSDANLSSANLRGADLRDADLSDAYLSDANLSDANLSDANLSSANLSNAYLSNANLSGANLSNANLSSANLSGANLSNANLSSANLRGANLRGADLSNAYLSGADLSGANLSSTTMPGFSGKTPQSLQEAAQLTKEWLVEGHWVQSSWIKTPTGAYSGDCLACLHGAAVYCGGSFGPELSKQLRKAGYNEAWNDEKGRTLQEVAKALDNIVNKAIDKASN